MKSMKENTIAQFFTDTGFQSPKGHNVYDFSFGFDSGADDDMKHDGYDGIPSTVADIRGDLNDSSEANEHPLASVYGDYYMFVDPGTRTNLDGREPLSADANRLNMEYHKKDLSTIDSASDVHLETLEQPVSEFPRHQQIHSQMEPSVMGPIDQSGVQPPQPGEIVLEQPQVLEGVEYPKGTRILVEMSAEDIYTQDEIQDDLFVNPDAKLCPLCYDPYIGDVCPHCKSGRPGAGAVRVGESVEPTGLGSLEAVPHTGHVAPEHIKVIRELEGEGKQGSGLVRAFAARAQLKPEYAMGVIKAYHDHNSYRY